MWVYSVCTHTPVVSGKINLPKHNRHSRCDSQQLRHHCIQVRTLVECCQCKLLQSPCLRVYAISSMQFLVDCCTMGWAQVLEDLVVVCWGCGM